jgi:hypothetical protein
MPEIGSGGVVVISRKTTGLLLARIIVEHLEADRELHGGQVAQFGLKPWRETEKWLLTVPCRSKVDQRN